MQNISEIPLLTKNYRANRTAPKLDYVNRCRLLLANLEKSQWWDSQRLSDLQFKRLKPLLVHAYQTVPYYREAFDRAGLNPRMVSPSNWHAVPILTRSALQAEKILSTRIPVNHGDVMQTSSSGSTGQPVVIHGTRFTQFFFEMLNIRECLWHKRDMTSKHASIKYFSSLDIPPEGITTANWSKSIARLFGPGPSAILSIRSSVEQQLEWLLKHNPDYLLTYPSNLAALLEESGKRGLSFPNLNEARTISETVSPQLRELCRETWGVPLIDAYSSQELGCIALQCPEHDHYHVQSESVLLEVLDDDGAPCKPGEVGRVVLTSLLNYATPLIRYEIRDYAEVGEPCDCGRGLPVIKRIVGRQRNMLVMPSGERCWPVFGMLKFRDIAPVMQMQFIQHSTELVEMKYTSERPLSADEEKQLQDILHKSLGHPFTIQFTALESFPQRKNGKREEFLSLIA